MKLTKILVLFSLAMSCLYSTQSAGGKLSDAYPLVRDERNFKESAGGKGVPAQGRILEKSSKSLIINEELLMKRTHAQYPWRYVVSVNCKRGARDLEEIIRKMSESLLPPHEKSRLALIIGINEKVTVEHSSDYGPEWKDLLPQGETLKSFGIPVLVQYVQWTSFRDDKEKKRVTADEIRETLLCELEKIKQQENERVYKREYQDLLKEDNSQGFPFGVMREFMINHKESLNFIEKFTPPNTALYIHIQDADFINFEETPLFYDFLPRVEEGGLGPDPLLFKKYDALIQSKWTETGSMPVVVGGAHVYSPQEDLGPQVSSHQKFLTRFGGEMGNMVKGLVGQFQPFGLYFHEPNTMILHPLSYKFALVKALDREILLDPKHRNISFGMDSELQFYTRKLFKDVSDQGRRDLMEFSSSTILSTSMSRGKGDSFVLLMGGSYEEKTKKFFGWSYREIMALHGMAQEIIHPNKWVSSVTTSMSNHRSQDARGELAKLFNMFDPHAMSRSSVGASYSPTTFFRTLLDYDSRIRTTEEALREIFSHLSSCYEKQLQGDLIGFSCISLAWECGQGMRAMFLQSFQAPDGMKIKGLPKDIARFLASRLNGVKSHGLPSPNPFVLELLGLNRSPLCMTVPDIASTIAYILVEFKKTKKAAAAALGTTTATLGKMQAKTSPRKSKDVVKNYLEALEDPAVLPWGLTSEQKLQLAQRVH